MFPKNAKVASVTPIDKKTDDKNSLLTFCPISVLTWFSKVYGNILKTQLVEKMNYLFSPFISACRESHNTQSVLIRLIEEWIKNLDNNYFIGAVLIDLSKAFDYISHDLEIAKLAAYGFDKNMICYIYIISLCSKYVNLFLFIISVRTFADLFPSKFILTLCLRLLHILKTFSVWLPASFSRDIQKAYNTAL